MLQAALETKQRVLYIDGTLNFRDLGGYSGFDGKTVQWGKIFRCAQLDRLEPGGIQSLIDLGINTVIDLRFEDETLLYPTIRAAFPRANFFSWQDEPDSAQTIEESSSMKRSWRSSLESGDPAQVREAMRINYPTKLYSHRAIYRRMLLQLLEQETPLVFHCAAGKDRTGVAAALILSLLGVDNDQIMQDYLLTQPLIEGRMEQWLAGGATTNDKYQDFQDHLSNQPREMIQPVLDADPAYMQTLLDYVADKYGSFETYALEQLELSSAQIEALRVQFLQ